jgi:hypothetical protein
MASSSSFLCKVSLCRSVAAIVLLGFSVPAFAAAKAPELSAIEVYPIGDSQGYVQISAFALNGKNEVHLCAGVTPISKGNYGKLPRVELAAGMSLEIKKDGVLLLSRGGAPECIVPGNLKLEKAEGETPAELAERAELSGQIVSKSVSTTDSIPRLTPGVKIVLVDTLNTELAEFLLAQRGGTIASWQGYLGKYPAGPHSGEAKAALSSLYVQDGQTALTAYRASLNDPQPNYAKLQAAKSALDYAMARAPSNSATDALTLGIQQEARALNSKGLAEIALYQTALASQSSGYSHLLTAEALLHITLNLDPVSPETKSLSEACTRERTFLDDHLVRFRNNLSANRPDEAFEAITPLRPFAQEDPEVQKALDDLYSYHVDQGKKDAEKSDLQGEVSEFKKAAAVESRPEIEPMIRVAEDQAQQSIDSAAIKMALTMSQGAEDDKDYFKAYEVLSALTPNQRKNAEVAERLDALKGRYVSEALKRAAELQRTYTSIKNVSDERQVQRAYTLFSNSYAITQDQNLQGHMRILGDDLSDYYLTRAKHFLGLPAGTGVNVGSYYLSEALQYTHSNVSEIRAEINAAKAAYDLRSRLSISSSFVDRTSTPEGVNFAARLTDLLATDLGTSSANPVKVVRPDELPGVPANFALTGDVLQNRVIPTMGEKNTKTSKYRAQQEVVNPEWSAANRAYESANEAFVTARQALQGAEASKNKKLIATAERKVADAQKQADDLRDKRDALQEKHTEQAEVAYTYTEQVNRFTAAVELQFVIKNTTGVPIGQPVKVPGTKDHTYTKLEGVKDTDTMSVHVDGEVPTPAQFLVEADTEVSGQVLKQAKEAIAGLPPLVLKAADSDAAEGDEEGAAEQYMLYLNSTAGVEIPERKRAQKFLQETYNFQAYGESAPQT